MRTIVLGLMVLSISTGAFAGTVSPLPSGKPAGVHEAVQKTTEETILIGIMAIGAGITAVLVANAAKGSSSSTTTSTSP